MDAAVPISTHPVAPSPSEGASLIQLVLILRRRWRLLAIVWAAAVAGVAVYTFTAKRLYRPQATLEIQPPSPIVATSEANDPAFMAGRLMWENYYRTQEQILTSPTLVQSAFRALPDVAREYRASPEPVKAFLDRLDIEKVRTSFVMKIGFIDPDAEKATKIVNVLVQLYLEDANRRLRELKSGAVEVLSKETLPAIRQKVDEADKAHRDFQQKTGFIDFEEHYKALVRGRNAVDARLTEIRLKRARVRGEVDALTSYGPDGGRAMFNPAFHSTRTLEPLVNERARIAAELARDGKVLKERHPRILELQEQLAGVDRKIRESLEGTIESLHKDLRAVEREEKELAEEQVRVDGEIGKAGANLNTFRRLESELASSKELYNSYLKKHGETSATTGAGLASVRVVDHATVPPAPFKPKVLTNLALSMVVGLLLGVGAIFVTEQLDDRIASPHEVEAFIGLDVLAVIPRLSRAATEAPILLDDDSGLPEFEAFRGLRAELVTRLERLQGAKVAAVLSAVQSEGKSTVTVNLAKVLAMEGRRILILDADMRRPSMRSLVGKAEGAGLEQVLRGESAVEGAVQKSRIAGVDVLGASAGTMSAAELAGSPRLEEVLRWARSRYDLILVDSAPVNQVSESSLVARRADAVILVIREGATGRGAVHAARKRLVGMGVNLVGAVLNCGRLRGGSYYGYYGSYYGYGSRDAYAPRA